MTAQPSECLRNRERLAERLVARHLRISVPDSGARDRLAEEKLEEYPTQLVETPTRCIAVVGAGASAPVAARSGELAGRLERKFGGRDDAELERLQLVNNLNPEEFETRMIALSKTPEAAQDVQTAIAKDYNIRHPTVLAYELIAHLMKHRFIDAVLNFNFDELLDGSLDDEVSKNEYSRLVSERDCHDVETDADSDEYLPLHIKLHGTASESSSLRMTRESYYNLPHTMVDIVRKLMETDVCIIINVGFGLASFDFQRLMRVPRNLEVFDLSFAAPLQGMLEKISNERRAVLDDSTICVDTNEWYYSCVSGENCDDQLEKLCAAVKKRADAIRRDQGGQPIEFRSTLRHQVIARMLGSGVGPNRSAQASSWSVPAEKDYLKKRAILELALAGAKARGLLSVVPLARDRPGRCYEGYIRMSGGYGDKWLTLCSAAGLQEATAIPDVLESAVALRASKRDDKQLDPTHQLHEFDPEKLAQHVAPRVKVEPTDEDVAALSEAMAELQSGVDVELQIQDDHVCKKVFRDPKTLRTATALTVYTWLMLRDVKPGDHVYISSETGAWLTRELIVTWLQRVQLCVLLAFDAEGSRLSRHYPLGETTRFRVTNPWHHNRHMTIVCDEQDMPLKAIYFARHLRSPVITPVYLESVRDAKRLLDAFKQRWSEADEPTEGPLACPPTRQTSSARTDTYSD